MQPLLYKTRLKQNTAIESLLSDDKAHKHVPITRPQARHDLALRTSTMEKEVAETPISLRNDRYNTRASSSIKMQCSKNAPRAVSYADTVSVITVTRPPHCETPRLCCVLQRTVREVAGIKT